eukprot:TRINITY_DN2486_c0_g1_i10.p1 TRINITY_DN2486_c0_g1~~TRINITY_DN2486_c0_g1_i10.p1  ORF type:complete len:414 (-),score=77.09 TRINITY_DN2486_c0_g1_i10:208-1449(-)
MENGDETKQRISKTSAVLWHARQNDSKGLNKLLQRNPSLANARDYDGRTALHVAAIHGCTEAARCLLQHEASVNALDRWQNSPLADAENGNHEAMIELLKTYGAQSQGNHGNRLGTRTVAPPHLQSCDWEIDPLELDFSSSILIGKGAFGEIWKATWRGTPVAVKRITPSLSKDKSVIKDFIHEVNLLVTLRHPNIIQFLGAVTKQQPLMLVTEYLSGGDLHQSLKGKVPLNASTAVKFALEIAKGMAYLHKEPNVIVHRDLKPRNILLVNSNHLKVGDFGLSKIVNARYYQETYKLTGETGSYRYMAPEVFKHRKYDNKVDVFSFAMILYEMLEGSPPFPNSDGYEAAKMLSKGERPVFHVKHHLPELKRLIEECWDGDSHGRPSFLTIVERLETIKETLSQETHWNFLQHS